MLPGGSHLPHHRHVKQAGGATLTSTDIDNGDALDVIETQLAVLARTLEQQSRRSELHRELDRAGYLLLRTLERTGPATINQLAFTLGLDGSTVTRQVAALDRQGLTLRRPHPHDRRMSVVALTANGRHQMHTIRQQRRQRVGVIFADWSPPDQALLAQLLTKLNTTLGTPASDHTGFSATASRNARQRRTTRSSS